MLTKQDCIAVGKAIAEARAAEIDNNYNTPEATMICNGVLIRALGNLWFDVFTAKQREYFGYNYEAFSDAVIDFNEIKA